MFRFGFYVAIATSVVAGSMLADAWAQTCHDMPIALAAGTPRESGSEPLGISMTLRNQFTTLPGGTFVGTNPQLGYQRGRWAGLVGLPMYRTAVGEAVTGVGDLTMEGSVRLWRSRHVAVAVAVATTAPTGDANQSLGMGHWMVMPSAAVSWQHNRWTSTAMIGGGKALGDTIGTHHHHGATGFPMVNPMNQFEANGMVRVAVAVTPQLAPEALGSVALPLEDSGVTRALAGIGATYSQGPWRLRPAVQLGVKGTPFTARITFDVGYAL
ncbi:MAG: transporter [Kofleriaceae bacterium]|nr:transporter [Kofleriaceae bacterium]